MNKDKKKEYYARMAFNPDMISAEERLFACLLVCGYPANRAYQISHPTKADANSAAALASRKVQVGRCKQFYGTLSDFTTTAR